MTFTLPAAVPAIAQADHSLACWMDNGGRGRCSAPPVSDLGLCAEHRDRLHDLDEP